MPHEQFRALRKQADLTQLEVATNLGLHPSSVVHWETGRSLPSGAMLVALSRLYRCTTDQLLGLKPLEQVGRASH